MKLAELLLHLVERPYQKAYRAITGRESRSEFLGRVRDYCTRRKAITEELHSIPWKDQEKILFTEKSRSILESMLGRKDIKPEFDKTFDTLCLMATKPDRHMLKNSMTFDVLEAHKQLFDKMVIIKAPISAQSLSHEDDRLRKWFFFDGWISGRPKLLEDQFTVDLKAIDAFFEMCEVREHEGDNTHQTRKFAYLVIRDISTFDIQTAKPLLSKWFSDWSRPYSGTREALQLLEEKMLTVLHGTKLAQKHDVHQQPQRRRNSGL